MVMVKRVDEFESVGAAGDRGGDLRRLAHTRLLHAGEHRAPGEPAAHALHQDELAGLDAAVAARGIQRQGTLAAEVLACWSTVMTTFSVGTLSLRARKFRMRTLAWCGISQSTSLTSTPASAQVSRAERSSTVTACLKTAWPSMRRKGSPVTLP